MRTQAYGLFTRRSQAEVMPIPRSTTSETPLAYENQDTPIAADRLHPRSPAILNPTPLAPRLQLVRHHQFPRTRE
jgi:hypothetical protein